MLVSLRPLFAACFVRTAYERDSKYRVVLLQGHHFVALVAEVLAACSKGMKEGVQYVVGWSYTVCYCTRI